MKSNAALDLYILIHSLKSHEKRYFHLYSRFYAKRKDSAILDLFQLVSVMAEYSHNSFFDLTLDKPYQAHLPSTINHLFNLILRCLRSYQAEKSVASQLRSQIESARILFERAQFRPALRRITSAKKQAEKAEETMMNLELLALEVKILTALKGSKLPEKIAIQQEESFQLLQKLDNEFLFSGLKDQHLTLRRTRYDSRSDAQAGKLANILAHPSLQGEAPEAFWPAQDFHALHGNQALWNREYELARVHFAHALDRWEKRPLQLREHPGLYIRMLADQLNACMYSKYWMEAERVIEKMKLVKVRTIEEELCLLNTALYSRLFYCLNLGKYEEGIEVISEIELLLIEHEPRISPSRKLNFFYNSAILFFVHGDFSRALAWLNRILNFGTVDLKMNLREFARVFELVIHFELGNIELVEYRLRATTSYFKKNRQKYSFEKTVFAALKALVFKKSSWSVLAPDLYEELWGLARRAQGKEPAGLYELIFWAQSKLENLSLKTVYLRRVEERMALVERKDSGASSEVIELLEQMETSSPGQQELDSGPITD